MCQMTMVKGYQVICTPWRDNSELLRVKRWLFPEKYTKIINTYGTEREEETLKVKRKACDQVKYGLLEAIYDLLECLYQSSYFSL